MSRTIVDLDARATVLDASERLAAAPPDGDIALMVAPGAPLLRSGVFLEVLRAEVGPRRLALVTTDPRARSVASSVHVPAYASLAALERQELDPTERLERARRAAIAGARPGTVARPRPSFGRIAAIGGSLLAAAAILAAVVLPEATVRVAAAAQPIGPHDLVIRGTTGGTADVTLKTITQPISAKVVGTATGARSEEVRARGSVQLENRTTSDVRVPKGSIFRTADGVQFLSQADVTLPRSIIVPPFELFVGKVTVAVDAAVAGPTGNVPAGRITVGPEPGRYSVSNPEPTTGGEIRRIPIVRLEDYDAARAKAPEALKAAGDEQLQKWLREPRQGEHVVPQVLVRQTSIAPAAADVVGKESFEIAVSGVATAYVAPDAQPRKAIASLLREKADAGNDVDDRGVLFDVTKLTVAEDGITWNVRAQGVQARRVDRAATARLLAGKPVREAERILGSERLRLVQLDWRPEYWPLLPILDARITVVDQP
jgi:hypothetical protein